MPEPLLTATAIEKTFDRAPVLRGVTVTVNRGEILAILGPSGSGKTTLLRMLNAMEEPDAGTVTCEGKALDAWDVRDLRRRVGMLFQSPTMFEGTVRDNLLTPLRLRDGRDVAGDESRMTELLAGVGLDHDYLDRDATTLSAGQQQRVAFARALMLEPVAILLDEPTANLDPTVAARLLDQVAETARNRGLAALLVTHQVDHAKRIADRLMLLVDGEIAADGDRENFFNGGNDLVSRFLAGELAEGE